MKAEPVRQANAGTVLHGERGIQRPVMQRIGDAGRISIGADLSGVEDQFRFGGAVAGNPPLPLEAVAMDRKRLSLDIRLDGVEAAVKLEAAA